MFQRKCCDIRFAGEV